MSGARDKMELQRIYESQDEFTTIMGLPSVVRNMLRRNEILTWHSRKMRISAKARDYLLLKFARARVVLGAARSKQAQLVIDS